jgi:hypothetical protein
MADARREHRIVEEQPGLVEDQEGRRAVEALVEAREEITQHGEYGRLAVQGGFATIVAAAVQEVFNGN